MCKHFQKTVFCLICTISFLLISTWSIGQPDPVKFGKVELKDLQMKHYAKDTGAAAVVLCDFGNSYFRYSNEEGFQVYFERITRIKILKKSGYDWADGKIPFYRVSNSSEEEISNLKGFTYNLNGNEIVKDKLTKESVFEEKLSDNWYMKKFSMPNVKEGSVIEFSYTIKSDFLYNFREWQFQESIPVIWSEYRAVIPEYFNYKQLAQGYEPINTEEKMTDMSFSIRIDADYSTYGERTPARMENVQAKASSYRWTAKDVPAMKEEPYMTTIDDFVSKIEFELASTKFPGQMIKTYTNTWEALTETLLKSEYFGDQLARTGFVKNELAAISAKITEPSQKAIAIYEYVRKYMKWNGIKNKYTETTTKKAYEARTGNSADINLLLVAILKEAGLEANPVILSTRDHGRIMESYALLSKFNYVIAHVAIGDKYLLLDATDPVIGYTMLPTRCLNGLGWMVSSRNPGWVQLQTPERMVEVFTGKFDLDANGELKGTVDISKGGYSGLSMRKAILSDGKDKYIEEFKKKYPSWQISKHDFTDVEELNKAINAKYEVTLSEQVQVAGNMMYIKPLLTHATDENPFKLENRKFPVDFAVPMDETFSCFITIPAGYKVEELPKGAIVELPEKSGRFTFMTAVNGNVVQVTSRISLKKPVYYAEEYSYLKEFFNQVITKHAEQVVLKKL
ncbi:DUF3857 and transglutaminase domain-containing protein [Rhodocytophaga rosea]|uniref:DUF3857 and transglutaminase domain-containing protein n=1 Tax=Rhodocytophaga rosea TaxID=2704465 RepID=A0A6C0GPB9_9BACT|nr:DUF3857 domain-containing protein [Rhodocytophaga rosea]QHT69767.1 DUF3857 and transglutaminase domain-containing protein [Rhodocytophaga rosea]